ncbi:hypothetical protein ACOMHN_008360 [Nucella lapillus]
MAAYNSEKHNSQCVLCPCPSCPHSCHQLHPSLLVGEARKGAKMAAAQLTTSKKRGAAAAAASTAAKDSSASGRLTRSGVRQRLLLNLPLNATASTTPGRLNRDNPADDEELDSEVGPIESEDLLIPQPFQDNASEALDVDGDSCDDDTLGSMDIDHNVNANKGRRGRRLTKTGKRGARKGRPKRWQIVAKKKAVQRAARVKTTGNQVVNFSALKPISARCSRSGLGLVVTYRPVFTKMIAKRRAARKKAAAVLAVTKAANNNTPQAVAMKDFSNNPRTPSPPKPEKSRSPGFFDQLKEVINRQAGNSQKDNGVKKWLQGVPQSTDPKDTKHRSPSPSKGQSPSKDRGAFRKPFTSAKYSARKSPIPGPSWSPDEFRQRATRSRSPYYMPSRRCSRTPPRKPRKRPGRSPRPKSPKAKVRSSAKRGSAVAEVYAGSHSSSVSPRRPRGRPRKSPLSPPPCRPASSKGWNVNKVPSPQRGKEMSPRSRQKGKGDDRGHEMTHRVSASGSGMTHNHAESRSRSRSHTATSLSTREGHRDKEEQADYRGRHRRHHRHHRYRRDMTDREESAKPPTCNVM